MNVDAITQCINLSGSWFYHRRSFLCKSIALSDEIKKIIQSCELRPLFYWDLIDLLNPKEPITSKMLEHNDTENSLLFMACAIKKSIKSIFSYDKKATWNRVKQESIPLPVDLSGEIDYSLIETFVSAIKKKAIQSLKEFIPQEHNAYMSVTR